MDQSRQIRATSPPGVASPKDTAWTRGRSGPNDGVARGPGVTHVRGHGGPSSLPRSRTALLGIVLTIGMQNTVTSCLLQSCKTPRGIRDLAGLRTRVTAPRVVICVPQVVCACASRSLLGNVVRCRTPFATKCNAPIASLVRVRAARFLGIVVPASLEGRTGC